MMKKKEEEEENEDEEEEKVQCIDAPDEVCKKKPTAQWTLLRQWRRRTKLAFVAARGRHGDKRFFVDGSNGRQSTSHRTKSLDLRAANKATQNAKTP